MQPWFDCSSSSSYPDSAKNAPIGRRVRDWSDGQFFSRQPGLLPVASADVAFVDLTAAMVAKPDCEHEECLRSRAAGRLPRER